jgi:hypothetical protein
MHCFARGPMVLLRWPWIESLIGNIVIEDRDFVFVTTIFGMDYGTVVVFLCLYTAWVSLGVSCNK